MPRSLPQRALARRALVDQPAADQRKWLQHGVAVLGISVLGLGVAGSVAATGNAQNAASPDLTTQPSAAAVSRAAVPGVAAPSMFDRRTERANRSEHRPALAATALSSGADSRSDNLLAARQTAQQAAQSAAIEKRADSLVRVAKATTKKAAELKKVRAAEARAKAKKDKAKARAAAKKKADEDSGGSGHASLPITSGYRVAARFGDTGSWARYHTGIDFSAAMGTPLHAVAAGVVTNAGSGSASWAGNYVAIRHSDGKTSLYAHMSSVTVHEGEKVSGGQRLGAVGMTGRTFGPHVHFEVYPSGAKVGDPYEAVDPAPWLHDRGLRY